MANVFRPKWDAERDQPPFRWRRARLGRQAGTENLGASLYELEPGACTFPLHAHYANEELIIVLAGKPTLRTLKGERALEEGDVAACPAGRQGAHRLDNAGKTMARVLIISTMCAPEINEMVEDGEFWLRSYPPGGNPDGRLDVRVRAKEDDHWN